MAIRSFRFLRQLLDVAVASPADGEVLTYDSVSGKWVNEAGGAGGGAPTSADYLVGTANGSLSAEIVVGTSPGGELGGTWGSPTVDATHSGSSHAGVQAAAEATAAAALAAHLSDSSDAHDASAISILDTAADFDATDVEGALAELQADAEADATGLSDHIGDASAAHAASAISASSTTLVGVATDVQGVLEELDNGIADHLADSADAHAGTAITNTPAGSVAATTVQAAINELDTEKAAAAHAHAGEDITSGTVADARIASTIARDSEVTAAVDAHVSDASAAHAASAISASSATLSGIGTDVQAVLEELDNLLDDHSAAHEDGGADEISLAGLSGTSAALQSHLDDTSAAHAASAISADSTTLVGTGTDVQAVLEELDNAIADHLADGSDAHDASAISILDTAADFDATDVEGALAELQSAIEGLSGGSGIPTDGWVAAGETWTYASADDPTFTFTIAGVDLTGKYQAGQRVKLTQTTAKYFIITKVVFSTDTTVTVYGGTDYDLANATITSPFWSPVKAPFGFPLDPLKWTITLISDTSIRTQASPTLDVWYNLGSLSGALHIGVWRVSYAVITDCDAGTAADFYVSLSTANNSESNAEMTSFFRIAETSEDRGSLTVERSRVLVMAAKTTHYLVAKAVSSSAIASVDFRGDKVKTLVLAECAHL